MGNRGGARPGAGRKKGSVNRATAEARTEAAKIGETPLEYMLRVMRDPTTEQGRRDDMAKGAAPYLHARLAATALHGALEVTRIDIRSLTDDQLDALIQRLEKKIEGPELADR
jgi:hypothetical protein